MPGEYDPAEELGLFPDRIFVSNLSGFVLKNRPLRDVCARFIRNGAHFYDVVERYDALTAYVLGREEASAGSTVKWVVPFLKANGASDYLVHQAYRETLEMMPNAKESFGYISRMLPTFVTTSMYRHGWLSVSEELGDPACEVYCSDMELDGMNLGRAEARKVRDMSAEIAALKIPKVVYELNVPTEVDPLDVKILKTMDDILQKRLAELPAMGHMESTSPVTSHKKAYQLLDIRKRTGIDLDSTMYMGGEDTDFQCLDLVRNASGVSVSFNGSDFAVRGCNIAVLSKDATVGAVLAALFYDRGIEAILELTENWNRKYLKNCDFPDRNLLDRMLANNPRKLPEVYAVDKHNVDEIAARSVEFRRKLLGPGSVRSVRSPRYGGRPAWSSSPSTSTSRRPWEPSGSSWAY